MACVSKRLQESSGPVSPSAMVARDTGHHEIYE